MDRLGVPTVPTIQRVKHLKPEIIGRYAISCDYTGWFQTFTALAGLAMLWAGAVWAARASYWSLFVSVPLISLFLLRIFALMHDCGHGCLFRSKWANRAVGFVFGVIAGMPQYVWARHHNFHHSTNGDWEKYRGAVATLSVREFAALEPRRQKAYARMRHIAVAPLGGFVYLVFNPRYTWLKGTLQLLRHVLRGKLARPSQSMRDLAASFPTRLWQGRREYWHMCWNNVALITVWIAMSLLIGPGLFFTIYLLSTSLAGAGGLILFTVQHNFEHAHATSTDRWDYDVGAMRGTSFLVLPRWLNWFTADIGYHHVHHLSASIPNYRLVRCHREYEALFVEVPRISLAGLRHALECILWDEQAERIISIAEYRRQTPTTG